MIKRGTLKLLGILIFSSIPLMATIAIGISRDQITPNDDFFIISKGASPDVNLSTWDLTVNGTVNTTLNYSYSNFTSLPSVEVKATLQCVEGPSGTAIWKGVWLKDVLDLAGLKGESYDVVFYAVDDYSSSLTVEESYADSVLLAYEMNGVPLPQDHGFPLRIVAPNHWGYKWVKWVNRIEVVDHDYRGFWETRGWDDDARLTTYNDWSIHAILFSITIMIGGLSVSSGVKFDRTTSSFKDAPPFMNRKFHQVTSLSYIASGLASFGFWLVTTYIKKGTIFYSIHGYLALISTSMLLAMVFLGIWRSRKKAKPSSWHKNIGYFSFILFMITVLIGFVMTISPIPRVFT